MAVIILIALALCAGSAQAASRIVGGSATTIDQYPYIAQVDYLSVSSGIWGQFCAASILTSTYVLSAAHCFHGITYEPKNRRIRAGSTYRNTGGYLANVEVEFNHPTYGLNGFDGDISVVKLSDPLTYSDVVAQGIFISQGVVFPDDVPVIQIGWGATAQGGAGSSELMETTVYTINNELCRERYSSLSIPEIVTQNMICTGILDVGGKDFCEGDDGGPLYYRDPALGNMVIGVISWNLGCGHESLPGVSTSVSPYIDWIVGTAV